MRVTFWMDEDILNAGGVYESTREATKNSRVDIRQRYKTEQLNSKKYFYDRL